MGAGSIGPVRNVWGRAVVVLLALAGAGFGLSWRADAVACENDRQAFLQATIERRAGAEGVQKLIDHCADPEQLAIFAGGVARTNRGLAEQMANAAADRAPETFASWAALALSRPEGSPGAVAAWRRAKALNPRWTQPAPN